ncbi:hypothetical protein PENSPDRAFT_33849 [Peniophora sp. CONT]|nr:hypothetical protein PENSPDRAFT_33849 [Peniophora sp. CONT]
MRAHASRPSRGILRAASTRALVCGLFSADMTLCTLAVQVMTALRSGYRRRNPVEPTRPARGLGEKSVPVYSASNCQSWLKKRLGGQFIIVPFCDQRFFRRLYAYFLDIRARRTSIEKWTVSD